MRRRRENGKTAVEKINISLLIFVALSCMIKLQNVGCTDEECQSAGENSGVFHNEIV
jgi:hypothetical protein